MNEEVTYRVLQACLFKGVKEFVVCAGSRNSSFVEALRITDEFKTYYWPEERSAAYFALGRSKLTGKPVAIVTTSGTAAGELLPATMEAFYSGVPLILITADRPPSFRGSGAPQSAEQIGLYGHYVQFCLDITDSSTCCLDKWTMETPIHLNVCLSEPQKQPKFVGKTLVPPPASKQERKQIDFQEVENKLNSFFNKVENPFVIVSTLHADARESVARFLLKLSLPAMIEGISGLREDPRLQHLRIKRTDKVLEAAERTAYPIDGILRIGGIPTHRIWRDLEYMEDKIQVCAVSEQPFSGLSWTRRVVQGCINKILDGYELKKKFNLQKAESWLTEDNEFQIQLLQLFEEEPQAEPSLVNALSKIIPSHSHVFLGNSLPIREWDMVALHLDSDWLMHANRGVNGIDGQLSTFLGLCQEGRENWGIFGDLTTLYDMAGLWILPQLKEMPIKIVIINNGGGKIFERMYPYKEMLNEHQLSFKPLADMWGLDYCRFENFRNCARQMIEIVPDADATARFWSKYASISVTKEQIFHH